MTTQAYKQNYLNIDWSIKAEPTEGVRFKRALNHARSDLPMPFFKQDTIEPCRGMDGKMHDTLTGLRKTYEPSGNPKGKRYIEIGNEKLETYKAPEFDRKQRRDSIKQALHDVKTGNVSPEIAAIQ